MPQHLIISVDDDLVGQLTTGNKGGTLYDVQLQVPELGPDLILHRVNVDTGVQRQPPKERPLERSEDYANDFIHATRCIAAAVDTADSFLKELGNNGAPDAEMRPIAMRLMTNRYDRGSITVLGEKRSVEVNVVIGAGEHRVDNALPEQQWTWTRDGVDLRGATSHTARALMVLRSVGEDLLQALLRASRRARIT